MLPDKIKALISRIVGLAIKALRTMATNPRALGPKLVRKIHVYCAGRFDLSAIYPDRVLIGGIYYPIDEMTESKVSQQNYVDSATSVVVIIPVYRDIGVTKRCIDSVLKARIPKNARILIIEDKSPDAGMTEFLGSYANYPSVTVLTNNENLGFVKTVNLGMRWAGNDDVVLLNSDTEVAGEWLERLVGQSISAPRIASVTATSNHATICSFPIMDERPHWPLKLTTSDIQGLFGAHNHGKSVEIPTAVGFCMYITRSALNDVGQFDEEAFGKGYGEECDFCMRALKLGWKHLQALDVGVFHQGEVSFAATSNPSKMRSEKIIHDRYPEYPSLVAKFAGRDPARAMRVGALLKCLGGARKPTELVVTHIHGGGVERFIGEVERSSAGSKNLLFLRLGTRQGRYRIYSPDPSLSLDFEFSPKYAPRLLSEICRLANVQKIQLHHVMDLDGEMIRVLRAIDIAMDFYMHDYWTLCPQITLTTRKGAYCGEPSEEVCNKCISERGLRPLAPLEKGLPDGIEPWREFYSWIFERADQIICPSLDVERRARSYYPKGKFKVRYLEDQAVLRATPVEIRKIAAGEVMKIAVLGTISPHKGSSTIMDLLAYSRSQKIPMEFYIAGTVDESCEIASELRVLGKYHEDELKELLDTNHIHLIWFPPGAPETYSYTLSHAMRFGYPIIAPRFGAFTERLDGRPYTWTHEIEASVSEIYDLLVEARIDIVKS